MFTQLLAESQEPDLIDEALKQSANFEKERLYQLLTTAGTRLKRDLAEHAKEKDYAIALKEAKERSENHVTFIKTEHEKEKTEWAAEKAQLLRQIKKLQQRDQQTVELLSQINKLHSPKAILPSKD